MRDFRFILILTLLSILPACSRNPRKGRDDYADLLDIASKPHPAIPKKPMPEVVAETPLPSNALIDPLERAQKDISLSAVIEGNKIRVTIVNKSRRTLYIGPKNLAVMLPKSTQVTKFKDPDPGFPPTKLDPGDERVALVSMRGLTDITSGSKLVFNHPDCQPAMAMIRWGSATQTPNPSQKTVE